MTLTITANLGLFEVVLFLFEVVLDKAKGCGRDNGTVTQLTTIESKRREWRIFQVRKVQSDDTVNSDKQRLRLIRIHESIPSFLFDEILGT